MKSNGKSKYKIILFLFVILIAASAIYAANETAYVESRSTEDYTFPVTIGNESYNGFCADNITVQEPWYHNYNISNDTSKIPDKALHIITKYYRNNNSLMYNAYIQMALYMVINNITDYPGNANETQKAIIQGIIDDQEGVNGNTYIDELGNQYIFDFKYLTTNEKIYDYKLQDIIAFKYEFIAKEVIDTVAKELGTNKKAIDAKKNTTIVDTVYYKNLKKGSIYTIKGILMDKITGKALLVNGKTVTAEKTFNVIDSDGFIDLEFLFDSSSLQGKILVVFQKLFKDGIEIATHEDINDPDQTIKINFNPKDNNATNDTNNTNNTPKDFNNSKDKDPINPYEPTIKSNKIPKINAAMEKTGLPIIAVLFVLLSTLGFAIKKRK